MEPVASATLAPLVALSANVLPRHVLQKLALLLLANVVRVVAIWAGGVFWQAEDGLQG